MAKDPAKLAADKKKAENIQKDEALRVADLRKKDKEARNKMMTRDDLNARLRDKSNKIEQLKEDRKNADTPAEKKAISQQIEHVQEKRKDIITTLKERDTAKVYDNTPGSTKSTQELLNQIYSSDEFLSLSKENQELLRQTVDSMPYDKLVNVNLSKQELNNIYRDAKNSTIELYNTDKNKYDQDYEQVLRQDTNNLKRNLDAQVLKMQADNAADAANTTLTAAQRQQNADNRIMAIRDLQDALGEAQKQYGVEADRKNVMLQNALGDIQKQLDTSLGRADEDKILQLRQLQRQHETELRSVQDNMAQRGLAVSGIRAQAESDLQGQYEDNLTTAQRDALRKKEDAQLLAEQSKRDWNQSTSFEIQKLVNEYTGNQQSAVKNAESQLGTTDTTGLLTAKDYSISGINPTASLYGGITGSINNNTTLYDAQDQARKLAAESRNTGNTNNLSQYYSDYERAYGTDALKKTFGGDAVIGATEGYAGYTPSGGITGVTTEGYAQNLKDAATAQADREAQVTQALKYKAFMTKAYTA